MSRAFLHRVLRVFLRVLESKICLDLSNRHALSCRHRTETHAVTSANGFAETGLHAC